MKLYKFNSEKAILRVVIAGISLAFLFVNLSLLFMARSYLTDQIQISEDRITEKMSMFSAVLGAFFNQSEEVFFDISTSPILLDFIHSRDGRAGTQHDMRAKLSKVRKLFKREIHRKKFKNSSVYSCFALLDVDGVPLVSYSEFEEKQENKTKSIYPDKIGEIEIDEKGVNAVFSFPLQSKGNLYGYLIAGMPMKTVKKILMEEDHFDSSGLFVVDDAKKIIPLYNKSSRSFYELLKPEEREENYIKIKKSAMSKEKFFICANKIKGTRFFLKYVVPMGEILERTIKFRKNLLIIGITFLLVFVFFNYILVNEMKALRRTKTSLEKSIDRMKKASVELCKLNKALLQIPLSIIITDTDGIIEYSSLKELEKIGLRNSNVRGCYIGDLIDDNLFDLKKMKQTLLKEGEWKKEVTNTEKSENSSWRDISVTASLVRDDRKNITHFLIILEDITIRKEMERQFFQSQKLESIGQLAAGIAHELNTPIQFIGDNLHFLKDSFSELLELIDLSGDKSEEKCDMEYLSTEIPSAIRESMDGVERVSRIVRAMKEFSHPGIEEQKEIDLNRVIANTVTVAKNEWKYVSNLTTDLDPDLPPVSCRSGEFGQVILNMIVNAAQSIEEKLGKSPAEKGSIKISTKAMDSFAEIRIEDTGMGIPEEIQDKIFDPFFTTKEVGKGTGQGLNISYILIVKKLGGSVSFETEIAHGTTFIIKVPLEKCVDKI